MVKSACQTAKNKTMKVNNNDTASKKYEDIHFVDTTKPVWNYSLLTDEVIRNYQNGTLYNAYEYFGSHEVKYWIPGDIILQYGHPMPQRFPSLVILMTGRNRNPFVCAAR